MAKQAKQAKQAETETQATRKERRITIKSVFGKLKDYAWGGGVEQLVKIAGIASGVERGTGEMGAWIGFTGTFAAANMATGEVVESTRVIIPGTEMMAENFGAEKITNKNASIRFAGFIVAKPRESDPQYFDLAYEAIIEPTQKNPALDMLNDLV